MIPYYMLNALEQAERKRKLFTILTLACAVSFGFAIAVASIAFADHNIGVGSILLGVAGFMLYLRIGEKR